MELIAPVTDYIPASLLTTEGDLIVRGVADAERIPQRVSFNAYLGTDYSLASAASLLIPIDTEIFDRGAVFDAGTGWFTVPRTGYYLIVVQGELDLGVADKSGWIRISCTTTGIVAEDFIQTANAESIYLRTVAIVHLVATEQVGMRMAHNKGVNVNVKAGQEHTFFCAYELI